MSKELRNVEIVNEFKSILDKNMAFTYVKCRKKEGGNGNKNERDMRNSVY